MHGARVCLLARSILKVVLVAPAAFLSSQHATKQQIQQVPLCMRAAIAHTLSTATCMYAMVVVLSENLALCLPAVVLKHGVAYSVTAAVHMLSLPSASAGGKPITRSHLHRGVRDHSPASTYIMLHHITYICFVNMQVLALFWIPYGGARIGCGAGVSEESNNNNGASPPVSVMSALCGCKHVAASAVLLQDTPQSCASSTVWMLLVKCNLMWLTATCLLGGHSICSSATYVYSVYRTHIQQQVGVATCNCHAAVGSFGNKR
jgi:hypothetical protein